MASDVAFILRRTGPQRGIRVAKHTIPHKLADAIRQALLRCDDCDVVAMGPEATSRAVVGIALASGHLAARALSVTCRIFLTCTPSTNEHGHLSGVLFRLNKEPLLS